MKKKKNEDGYHLHNNAPLKENEGIESQHIQYISPIET